jgi:hypothetical protein
MTFRARLLSAAIVTLAVGLGSLLVIGNVLLAQRSRAEVSSVMRANADSQISALLVTPTSVRVRDTANDDVLDRHSWVLDGDHVVERPPKVEPALDRIAVEMGRLRQVVERDGPDDVRLRAEPVRASGVSEPVGAVVVAYSTESVEALRNAVLFGSLTLAVLVLFVATLVTERSPSGPR